MLKKSPIRLILILGLISITGAVITQVYWVKKALQVKEANFDDAVLLSLRRVAERLDYSSTSTIKMMDAVTKISPRSFQINLNDKVDCNTLEFYLRTELSYPGLNIDFNYDIFEVGTDHQVLHRAVDMKEKERLYSVSTELPFFTGSAYYVVVNFPTRSEYIGVKMTIWIFSSFILLIVVFFFFYTIFVILRQFRVVQMQKDFISNMAHEFKTPISTISISAEVLRQPGIGSQPERLTNYANIIKNEIDRLRNQVDKLLQMSRMERDKIELHLEEISLHDLLIELIPNFSLKLDERNGSVVYHFDAKHDTIMADRVHLTNIIYNLLDNAIKYSGENPVIEVSTYNERDEVILSVHDNGIGIPEEYQQKVFDKFFRVPTGNIHDVKGFGLGLHYLKLVVYAHKWSIHLVSKKGEGSNFIISIPYISNAEIDGRTESKHLVG